MRDELSDADVATLCHMLDELQSMKLEVCKVRTDSGYVRVPVCSNPDWYSRFCNQYMKPRKRHPRPRTVIRRANMIRSMKLAIESRSLHDGIYGNGIKDAIEFCRWRFE